MKVEMTISAAELELSGETGFAERWNRETALADEAMASISKRLFESPEGAIQTVRKASGWYPLVDFGSLQVVMWPDCGGSINVLFAAGGHHLASSWREGKLLTKDLSPSREHLSLKQAIAVRLLETELFRIGVMKLRSALAGEDVKTVLL